MAALVSLTPPALATRAPRCVHLVHLRDRVLCVITAVVAVM